MFLYGAGGHAKVIMDILYSMNIPVDGVFDDDESLENGGGIKIQKFNPSLLENYPLIISIGNNENRKIVAQKLNVRYGKAIHPSASISGSVLLKDGTVVMHAAVLQAGVSVGNHCIINTSATIDHDCQLGDFTHIAPNATLCGNVSIGEGTLIGAGTVIIPGIKIGRWVTVGAGSVIVRDIPDHAIVVGNPGRILKYHNQRY